MSIPDELRTAIQKNGDEIQAVARRLGDYRVFIVIEKEGDQVIFMRHDEMETWLASDDQ